MPRIELLVVQPTPFCNIDCRYCYLPERNSKAVVARETLANLFSQVFASGWLGDGLSVVWHAGEPMVLPIAFYRDAFRLIDRLKPAGLPLAHSFQTNGTLIDEAWCAFFADERVNVGVSIDGPRQFHDRNRLTRAGRGTFDKTIAGIRLLRRHEVPFHVISVLSTESMAAPGEMFDFYVAEGIERVCFNVEESEGDHVSRSFAEIGVEAAYYRFLSEFWRLSAAAPGKITFIREIEHAVQQVIRPADAPFANQLVEPFAIISMDWAGNISTFSPELLGLKNPAYEDFLLGEHQSRQARRFAGASELRQDARRHPGGRRDVPGALRIFQRVRRRRAGQQARRKWDLCQHRDDLLPSDQDAGDRSGARCARAGAAGRILPGRRPSRRGLRMSSVIRRTG